MMRRTGVLVGQSLKRIRAALIALALLLASFQFLLTQVAAFLMRRGGFVHLLGSDGHGLDRRQPRLRAGYDVMRKWAGEAAADRIGHIWASGVLEGRAVNPPKPLPPRRSWFARMFGG